MALYTIGDLHLSFSCDKPMDIFKGWQDHPKRLEENWNNVVSKEDTVVVVGDLSWGMSLEEAAADFDFIERLNGQKILLRGNHDYWFSTKKKCEDFFEAQGYRTMHLLFNNAFSCENIVICGTRGWMLEQGADQKVLQREVGRLRMSLEAGKAYTGEPVAFLHYPPVYYVNESKPLLDVLAEYGIRRCYYGHIHGTGFSYAIDGVYRNVDYHLVSCDYVDFTPVLVSP